MKEKSEYLEFSLVLKKKKHFLHTTDPQQEFDDMVCRM